MRLWRQLIAAILVIAFVPATLLAALPLVYCLGADGHRAVELLNAAPHHSVEHTAPHTVQSGHGGAVDAPEGCVDIELLALASTMQRSSDSKSALHSAAPQVAACAVIDFSWTMAGPPPVPSWHRQRVAIDYLASHRTVVLLM
jgi:hypothetical protein